MLPKIDTWHLEHPRRKTSAATVHAENHDDRFVDNFLFHITLNVRFLAQDSVFTTTE